MNANEQLVRDFVAVWPSLNVDAIVGYFAEDGVYHNMMIDPVKGHAALKDFIGGFMKDWSDVKWDILNVSSAGNLVFAERVDHFTIGGKPVDLPCCGVFEIAGGKIGIWRDYFDMGTYMKAFA